MQFLCIVCLPVEMKKFSDDVMDGKQSVVWQEALNRMHVQKSIIQWCLNLL